MRTHIIIIIIVREESINHRFPIKSIEEPGRRWNYKCVYCAGLQRSTSTHFYTYSLTDMAQGGLQVGAALINHRDRSSRTTNHFRIKKKKISFLFNIML